MFSILKNIFSLKAIGKGRRQEYAFLSSIDKVSDLPIMCERDIICAQKSLSTFFHVLVEEWLFRRHPF